MDDFLAQNDLLAKKINEQAIVLYKKMQELSLTVWS